MKKSSAVPAVKAASANLKKSAPKTAQKVKQAKRVSPELAQYAKQFMLPISCDADPLQVSPAEGSYQLCVRHLHRVVDVDSNTLANGFTAVMSPDLFCPGFISNAAASVVPAALGPLYVTNYLQGTVLGAASDPSVDILQFATSLGGDKTGFRLLSIADSAAASHIGFNLVPNAATTMKATITNTRSPGGITIYTKAAGGAWALLSGMNLTANQTFTNSWTIPLNTDAIAFYIGSASQGEYGGFKVELAFDNAQLTTAAANTIGPAFQRYVFDNNITQGRVISMSLLATNTSAEVANGGNVNAARMPRQLGVFGSLAQNVSLLPENRRYQGPASTGAYVWWMPGQLDEFEPDNINSIRASLAEADLLVVNVSGWAPGAGLGASTFRIHFDWVVEFYTPNQIFEKVQTPPMLDTFELLYHRLLMMPAATCNPSHSENFKALIRKGIEYGKKGYAFYKENQAAIDTVVLAILAAMA